MILPPAEIFKRQIPHNSQPDFLSKTSDRVQVYQSKVTISLKTIFIITFAIFASKARANEPGAAADLQFFESKIRPVLIEHCYKCHSAKSEKLKGDLRLDNRNAALKGGKTGPAIAPGKPNDSLLIKAIRYTDSDLQMPPKYQLPPKIVSDLEQWVQSGASWPADSSATTEIATDQKPAAKNHWAFQPLRANAPPTVHNEAWPQNQIDRFILANLEHKSLTPASPADKRTLIRRAYFDLIGLPPTPEEVEAFLKNDSPNAFAEVIDHLLASPYYGERWGRYWLDLARYADTNGADENYAFPNAWRYRDYVVRAFNADKPYDQFVTEQLAGDLLPGASASESEKQDHLIATGFLVVGPKMLAEQDKPKLVMDVIDEQIDVTAQTFLGLTVGCARCHDHKFDPIPTADYYALAGIFKSTQTMANLGFVSEWVERDLADSKYEAQKKDYETKIAPTKKELTTLTQAKATEYAWLLRSRAIGKSKAPAKIEAVYSPADLKKLKELRTQLAEFEKNKPPVPQAMSVREAKPQNVPIHLRGSHLTLAKEETPRGFVKILDRCVTPPPIPPTHSGRLELADWITNPANPLTARVMVNRIWQGHFGTGLVSSSSNFGLRGSAPSNPELLNYLSTEFIRRGWSIKQMHRLIMLSSAYQMSSAANPEATEIDPENHLLSHQNRRRLEAEPIRDSLLAIGGNLDLTIGGSLTKPAAGKYNAIKDNDAVFDSTRRALYLPIVRSRMYDLFTIFDYVDAGVHTPIRSVTTVPQQALFMLNSELVEKEANLLAQRVLSTEKDNAIRINHLYQLLYARPPTPTETARALAHLASFPVETKPSAKNQAPASWASLCRVLLAANEFVYVN